MSERTSPIAIWTINGSISADSLDSYALSWLYSAHKKPMPIEDSLPLESRPNLKEGLEKLTKQHGFIHLGFSKKPEYAVTQAIRAAGLEGLFHEVYFSAEPGLYSDKYFAEKLGLNTDEAAHRMVKCTTYSSEIPKLPGVVQFQQAPIHPEHLHNFPIDYTVEVLSALWTDGGGSFIKGYQLWEHLDRGQFTLNQVSFKRAFNSPDGEIQIVDVPNTGPVLLQRLPYFEENPTPIINLHPLFYGQTTQPDLNLGWKPEDLYSSWDKTERRARKSKFRVLNGRGPGN